MKQKSDETRPWNYLRSKVPLSVKFPTSIPVYQKEGSHHPNPPNPLHIHMCVKQIQYKSCKTESIEVYSKTHVGN